MSGPALARSTMKFGIRLGIAAVVLIVLGPLINGNFGAGLDLAAPLLAPGSAPSAVVVSLTYLVLVTLSLFLSAILITASLVIRSAAAAERIDGVERDGVNERGQAGQARGPR